MIVNRVILFSYTRSEIGSADCCGWVFGYEADDATQAMIKKHAETYNGEEAWHKRNCDGMFDGELVNIGNVYVYDSVEDALSRCIDDCGVLHSEIRTPSLAFTFRGKLTEEGSFKSLRDVYEFFQDEGRDTTAAWVVHMLLSNNTKDWLPPRMAG